MKENLIIMTDSFTANNTTIYKNSGFQIISRHTANACAFLFTANKVAADSERIKESAEIVKNNAPKMSYFKMEPNYKFASAFLALSNSPERLLEEAAATYDKLKASRGSSQYMAFAGLLLASMRMSDEQLAKRLERNGVIFDCLKSRHKILTDVRDAVFTLMLASSVKNVEDIMTEVESTYNEIKGLGEKDAMQMCALILTRSDKPQQEKIARFTALCERLKENKPRYNNGWDMPLLAVLSLLTDNTEDAVNDINDVFNELAEKEGYKGVLAAFGKSTRLWHAAMIVTASVLTEEMYELAVASVFVNEIIKYDIETSSNNVYVPV